MVLRLRRRHVCNSTMAFLGPTARPGIPQVVSGVNPERGPDTRGFSPPRDSPVLGCWMFELQRLGRVSSQWGSGAVVALQLAQAQSGTRLC
ncbi:hypothetical protein NDU88_006465 [Pleurodeles waltl]|uniref:Uncharacterized protein n=1 Tax=Pleurodeles waltl TaxID=8319 RepID=A0AAV7VM03_PLEWA|nr:hypothetical protein NDU88_006465 [Pleurodeles waltl]